MEPRTAAASVGFGILLLAWLASALSEPRPPVVRRPAPAAEGAQLERLRTDVETQAARLPTRLAAPPVPNAPDRNPFAFGRRDLSPARPAPPVAEAQLLPFDVPEPLPVEPILVLIGVAERASADGVIRTAILAGAGDELHLVTEGEEVAGLYRVRAISADAVELETLGSTTVRRLHLK
jgi:hypothetical protein